MDFIGKPGENLIFGKIKDSLVFAMSNEAQEYFFSVSDFKTGNLLGRYCRRGRSGNEPISMLPIMEFYNEDLKTNLFSYHDSKVFVWNISKTFETGLDTYDKIITLHPENGDWLPLMSFYRLQDKSDDCL